MKSYFNINVEDSLKDFNVTKDGLTSQQVTESLSKNGLNALNEKKKQTVIQVFLSQFKD